MPAGGLRSRRFFPNWRARVDAEQTNSPAFKLDGKVTRLTCPNPLASREDSGTTQFTEPLYTLESSDSRMLWLAAVPVYALMSAAPRFVVKFVDLEGLEVNKNHCITDARKDLRLAGNTSVAMVDVNPAAPLAIDRGHPRGMRSRSLGGGDGAEHWPYAFLGDGRAISYVGTYPEYEKRDHLVVDRPRGNGWLTVARGRAVPLPHPGRSVPFTTTNSNEIPRWAVGVVKSESPDGYEFRTNIGIARATRAIQLINLTYYPITHGYETCMFDAERVTPFVLYHGYTVPLSYCVDECERYGFEEIVWVSREGWFVARASRNGHDGFAWLYPTRSRWQA